MSDFSGFRSECIEFISEIEQNNNKQWFKSKRAEYNEYLLNPMKKLVADLAETMLTIDSSFQVQPAVNKTISRIFRDTRFSKDKSPLRDSMWITFKLPVDNWQDTPVYYFELMPSSYRYGMGFYAATPQTMANLRLKINNGKSEIHDLIKTSDLHERFNLEGESYKKIQKGNNYPELDDWYQKRNLYFIRESAIDETIFSADIAKLLKDDFLRFKPFYQFLKSISSQFTKQYSE